MIENFCPGKRLLCQIFFPVDPGENLFLKKGWIGDHVIEIRPPINGLSRGIHHNLQDLIEKSIDDGIRKGLDQLFQ